MFWYLLDHSFFEIVRNRLETSIVELKAIVDQSISQTMKRLWFIVEVIFQANFQNFGWKFAGFFFISL